MLDQFEQELVVTLPPGAMHVEGDLVRLTQVFTNLLTNAAKFTSGPGTVRLAAARSGDELVVRIADSGIGIAADDLGRIFDKFYQGAQRGGRFSGGLGIGLSLVRRLVELHGGTVTAHSAGLERGSEFIVRLPSAIRAGQASPSGGARGAGAAADSKRVLIVDDNADGADSLGHLLSLMGHESATEYDGPSALERAKAFAPDVVLLDLGMPGMDGFDVCRNLRQAALRTRPTIVAMTGWGRQEDRTRTKEAGFDDHLVKPVDRAQLEAVLTRTG
jgi:CheY-like chemotaxis protein